MEKIGRLVDIVGVEILHFLTIIFYSLFYNILSSSCDRMHVLTVHSGETAKGRAGNSGLNLK